jgi:serine phosphatase RsbU (regulator of sigma subunit)
MVVTCLPWWSTGVGYKETLKVIGLAVGLAPGAIFSACEVNIEPGDLLFAHSDGLTDTINPAGEYLSEKQLVPMFIESHSLASLINQIQGYIKDYSTGASQIDDITMLAIRRL